MLQTTIILTIFLQLCLRTFCFSQADSKNNRIERKSVYATSLRKYAQFPGGQNCLKLFLKENLKWPSPDWCGQVTVYVQFIVSASGTILESKIVQGLDKLADKEAMRVVSIMPKWVPANDDMNKRIASRMTIPIKFILQ